MFLKKIFLCTLTFLLLLVPNIWCHGSWTYHKDDMMAVLGFDPNFMGNEPLTEWMRYISSDLIDKTDFHKYIKSKYGIDYTSYRHRYLFHWGYDSKPWNNNIERRIRQYCEQNDKDVEQYTQAIQDEIRQEQKRRNRELNKRTEDLFGFAHGGRDAQYARFFAAMAYDVHILGDYEPDNTLLGGLQNFDSLIGHIETLLRTIDPQVAKPYIKGIRAINNGLDDPKEIKVASRSCNLKSNNSQQVKACKLMAYLKINIPKFIDKACNGSIKRRVENKGFKFI